MANSAQIAPGAGNAPQSYEVPNATSVIPRAINATFDGTAASGTFTPTVEIISDGGVVVARIPCDTSVAAGASAECSFFPRVRKVGTQPSQFTYAQTIAALASTNTLVAMWRLNEGATPWADTSGFNPGAPETMSRSALVTAMTQNFTPSALADGSDAFAIGMNGLNPPAPNGDLVDGTVPADDRFNFTGTTHFSIVAWVRPFGDGGDNIGGIIRVTASSAGNDRGYQLGVTYPDLKPFVQRIPNIPYPGPYNPPTATGLALTANTWSMVAGTYDGANLRVYANGALQATTADVSNLVIPGLAPEIGGGLLQAGTQRWFYGAISEVSVWRSALSTSDIGSLYAAGITP